jgi:phytoene/squalene synthetase
MPGAPPRTGTGGDVEIFLALGETIRAHRLPVSLFTDLVSAFRQDITVKRYASWAELLDYCRRSRIRSGGSFSGLLDTTASIWIAVPDAMLHGAAAHELLAGPADRLRAPANLFA